MPQTSQSLSWQRRIPGRGKRHPNPVPCESVAGEEPRDSRRLLGDLMHYLWQKDITQGPNSPPKEMHWETDWPGCHWIVDTKWGEDLKAGCLDAGQPKLGAIQPLSDCALRAGAGFDRELRRQDLQNHLWDPGRPRFIPSLCKMKDLNKLRQREKYIFCFMFKLKNLLFERF